MHRLTRTLLSIASIYMLLLASQPTGLVQAFSQAESAYAPDRVTPLSTTAQADDAHSPSQSQILPSHVLAPDTPPDGCPRTAGKVLSSSLDSHWLGEAFRYRIYLPPCYSASYAPGYPVLYLIHGMGSTEDQWDRMGIDEAADRLITTGQVDPFIMVLPFDNSIEQPDQDPFDEALMGELIPWIDAHYQTRPERAFRAVGGLSRGASWALHLGLVSPEVFGAVGAHSLPIFWNDSAQLSNWLDAIPPEALPRMYLDIGRGDGEIASVLDFEASLTRRNIPHEFHLNNGYHEEGYWSAHLEQYLRWYAQGWEDLNQ